ncbi:hypothetical protein [Halalkalibacter sp. APA_J-10(15)]|uniref:hypothetical protein n=1 Tax=unclassified Halalkalibacter TaxID=2893063 RepID=UPI001FF46E56|nr:hypothetical protein [Halalkalibacter sp. APA_J-10(15)]MCK0473756.1 hypothetical protein [Halalkalibacter sp. APA_J-10(15)]
MNIEKLFRNEEDLSVPTVRKELTGMKNSQPPQSPTFIINQQVVKDRITQKLLDCDSGWDFAHIVLTGRVGGGKTHFLNWIESRLKDQGNYYTMKFQVQETNVVKYSFVRMVVSKLFQLHFSDFTSCFKQLVNNMTITESQDRDTDISIISEKLGVSSNLATLFFTIYKGENKSSAAMRVLGASHGRTEISKLGIRELNNTDYINIIHFFVKGKKKEGFLLILLDEFEHAFSALTTAARRNFYISYKEFIDKVISFEPPSVALITSVTEQYEGNLKEAVSKGEFALWTRLEHHVLELSEFNPSDVHEFEELFHELAVRYQKGYGYDVGLEYAKEMKKQFYAYLGDTTQAISYRDAISNMLKIMDDLRLKGKNLSDFQKEKQVSSNLIDNIVDIKTPPNVKTDEERILDEVSAQWQKAHHNQRPGLIKSSLEKIFSDLNYQIVRFKTEFGLEELASVLYIRENINEKLIYIATASNPKSLGNKFQRCLNFKDELSEVGKESEFATVFVYQKEAETETVLNYFRNHPDIINVPLDQNELLNLLAYSNANTNALKKKLSTKFERFVSNFN